MMRCGVCRSTFQAGSDQEAPSLPADFFRSALKSDDKQPTRAAQGDSAPRKTRLRFGAYAAGLAGLAGIVGVIGGIAYDFERFKAETTHWIANLLPGVITPRLAFDNIRTRFEGEGADRALIIEGVIHSDASTPHNLPGLSFEIRSGAGDGPSGQSIFQWMIPPPAPTIDRESPVPFRARLASPPREGKDIVIRLAGA